MNRKNRKNAHKHIIWPALPPFNHNIILIKWAHKLFMKYTSFVSEPHMHGLYAHLHLCVNLWFIGRSGKEKRQQVTHQCIETITVAALASNTELWKRFMLLWAIWYLPESLFMAELAEWQHISILYAGAGVYSMLTGSMVLGLKRP